ncbi:MAG TPA: PAS domain S-box protein [Pyrinomonadaceae bacterium]|nr:PAS domain S-box protein [Pyrinomonadaceae bacterium]
MNDKEQSTILVIDDTPDNHEFTQALLSQAGYRVLHASDGREGFELARKERPDLIISDVAMPQVDGFTVCRWIREDEALRGTPVLLVSAHKKDAPSVILGLEAGADDYLEAPYEPLKLIAKAARLIEVQAASKILRESEERFRLMADVAPMMLWMSGSDKRLTYVNKSWTEFTGSSAQEECGREWLTRIHPLDRERCRQAFEAAVNGRCDFKLQYRTRRFDGEYRWVLDTGTPRFIGQSVIEGYIGTCIDITDHKEFEKQVTQMNLVLEERVADRTGQLEVANAELRHEITEHKLTEQALRESDERFKAFMDNSPTVAFVKHEDGRYLYGNSSFKRRVSVEWQNRTDWDLWPKEIATVLREHDQRVLETGETLELEEVTPEPDGSMTFWWTFKFPLRDVAGRRYLGGIAVDVTSRILAEKECQEYEKRCTDLVENARDIIYTHDLNGRFTSLNKAGEQITGYTREEALQMHFIDVIAPQYLEKATQILTRKLSGETMTVHELEIIAKDSRRLTVEINSHPIYRDGVAVGMQGVARDITERRRLEQELRQAQKMESVGRLAGGIAHDFNNLITIINGYTGLLLKHFDKNDPLTEKLEEIKKAGDRATSLTYQLLAFSRKQLLQPKLLNVNSIVTEMEKLFQRLIGEDIELVTVLHTRTGQVKVDPGQVSQVIMNLVVNARDAMPQGGKLTVETDKVFLDPEFCRHHLGCKVGSYCMIGIADTGSGMDEETRRQIFEPFFTTKEAGKGTGLGLSTVYGIIKQSGGYIDVESALGRGSTFRIYLPVAESENQAELETVESVDGDMPRGDEHIMLVEDEVGVRTLAKEILNTCGYQVVEANDGIDAMSLQHKNNDSIDLLITDVVMPGMSGRELMEQLSKTLPDLRVLYISGYTDDAIVRHGLGDGTAELLLKPFTPSAFAAKVREVLDRPSA